MLWYLVILSYTTTGGPFCGDTFPSTCSTTSHRIELQVPSEKMCQELKELNTSITAECWAKKEEKKKEASIHRSITLPYWPSSGSVPNNLKECQDGIVVDINGECPPINK